MKKFTINNIEDLIEYSNLTDPNIDFVWGNEINLQEIFDYLHSKYF